MGPAVPYAIGAKFAHADRPVTALVGDGAMQMNGLAEPQTLPDVDYAGFARSLGMQAIDVDAPDQLGRAWDLALTADRPTLLDVRCDPEVPPIPPHATLDQMKSLT